MPKSERVAAPVVSARCRDPAGRGKPRDLRTSERPWKWKESLFKCKKKGEQRDEQTARQYRRRRSGAAG